MTSVITVVIFLLSFNPQYRRNRIASCVGDCTPDVLRGIPSRLKNHRREIELCSTTMDDRRCHFDNTNLLVVMEYLPIAPSSLLLYHLVKYVRYLQHCQSMLSK